ncbi:hypothetical protein Dimus_037036 [Dionaea muscipula]
MENLLKKRMSFHVDAVKEFYAKMTGIHLKKKDVVKSSAKGISIEFDHERPVAILDVPQEPESWNTSRRCGKSQECDSKIWEERHFKLHGSDVHGSPNGKKLLSTLVNKKGEDPKRYDYFEETFLTMCKLRREDGICWIGSGENRRRDDTDVPAEEEIDKEEENQTGFDWEAVIDEATVEGESGSREKFYDAEEEAQGSPDLHDEIPAEAPPSSTSTERQGHSRVDPRVIPAEKPIFRNSSVV